MLNVKQLTCFIGSCLPTLLVQNSAVLGEHLLMLFLRKKAFKILIIHPSKVMEEKWPKTK